MPISLDGTLGINSSGNVTAPYFHGNGAFLTGISGGGGSGNSISSGNSNIAFDANGNAIVNINSAPVAAFTPAGVTLTGNLNPATNVTYSLGNATNQWKDLWVSNATIYLNSVPLSSAANGALQYNGNDVVTSGPNVINTGNVETTGNIVASYIIGDGSQLTNLPAGSQGTTGAQGAQGGTGSATTIIGSIALTSGNEQAQLNAAFPSAVSGNGVIDTNTGNLWVLASGTWNNVGNIVGPQGTTGSTGAQGTIGITGSQGPTGPIGVQGIIGATGAQGATGAGTQGATGSAGAQGATGAGTQGTTGTAGAQGASGTQGATGAATVIIGAIPLTPGLEQSELNSAFPTAVNGNGVVDTLTNNLWVLVGGLWDNVGNIVGAQGIQGSTGIQGSVGIQGPLGPTGSQGTTGSQGVTGIQGTIGSTGAQGTIGPVGSQGTIGSTGVQGAIGSTGTQGTIGSQGVQGTLGAQGPVGPSTTINATTTAAGGLHYPVFVAASGSNQLAESSTSITVNPSTSTVNATNFAATANITATGNVRGTYILGNGAFLTGISGGGGNGNYGDSNVALFLESGSDTANIITTGNISGGYVLGNGAFLTGVAGAYGNAEVSAYLASGTDTANITTTGNVNSGNVLALGNITATTYVGNVLTSLFGSNANITIDPDGVGYFNITARTPTTYSNTINATNTVTGAVTMAGGLGIAKDLYANNINSTNALNAASAALTAGLTVGANISANNLSISNIATVTGNLTAANFDTAGKVTATGNIASGGNLNAVNAVNAGGNITGLNLITTGVVSAIGNITTSANLLVSGYAAVTGNVSAAGITTGAISATGDISAANFNTTGAVTATGNIASSANVRGANLIATNSVTAVRVNSGIYEGNSVTITAAGTNQPISLITNGSGNIVLNNTNINGLIDPVQPQDAATKSYVDAHSSGLTIIPSSNVATTASLPAYIYNNGASGVGATLTAQVVGNLVIDTVLVSNGQRVLVKDEAAGNAPYNGVYIVTRAGGVGTTYILTRATDDDTPTEMPGAFTLITEGFQYGGCGFTQITQAPITIGTTDIQWAQFSAPPTYQAGNGLSLNGAVFSVNVDNLTTAILGPNVVVKADAVLTTPNIGNASYSTLAIGSGQTGNVATGNITNGGTIISTGNVVGSANINGVNLNASSAITAGTTITATGNLVGLSQLLVTANASVNGNVSILKTAYIGPTANALSGSFTNPVLLAQGQGFGAFDQVALVGSSAIGSADIIAYANNGNNLAGFADIGVTGNAFTDVNYTITKPNDAYFFGEGTSSAGGNLVIATGALAPNSDIVFATDGFLAANEKLRITGNVFRPAANAVFSLGDSTHYFANVYTVGINSSGNLVTSGNISANNVTVTNSTTTGALTVTGATTANTVTANAVTTSSVTTAVSVVPGTGSVGPFTGSSTVWTAPSTTITGIRATVRMQVGTTNSSLQMADIMVAQDATGNAVYAVYSHVNTSTSVANAVISATNTGGFLAIVVNSNGVANMIVTTNVVEFIKT